MVLLVHVRFSELKRLCKCVYTTLSASIVHQNIELPQCGCVL